MRCSPRSRPRCGAPRASHPTCPQDLGCAREDDASDGAVARRQSGHERPAWPGNAMSAGPYTPAVRAGEWLVISGQVGLVDGKLVSGGTEGELRQALTNLRGHLEANGASLSNVVKTTVFLRHMSDYGPMNDVYMEEFGEHRPARSAIGVAELPIGALVEVEAWAFLG